MTEKNQIEWHVKSNLQSHDDGSYTLTVTETLDFPKIYSPLHPQPWRGHPQILVYTFPAEMNLSPQSAAFFQKKIIKEHVDRFHEILKFNKKEMQRIVEKMRDG